MGIFVKGHRRSNGEEVEIEYNPESPFGDSTLFQEITLAFDTPGFMWQLFPIIAVDMDVGTFTIDGDHADLFPETAEFKVSGSTMNDGIKHVVAVNIMNGTTVISIDTESESMGDSTPDGVIYNSGTAGVVLTEKTGYLGDILNVIEDFDGSSSPTILITQSISDPWGTGYVSSYDFTNAVDDPPLFYSAPFTNMKRLTGPLRAILSDNGEAPLAATRGQAILILGSIS